MNISSPLRKFLTQKGICAMHIMEYKGYQAKIKRAPKLDNTRVHGLPPGSDIEVFPVDAFKEPLPNWLKGAGNYVVPVESDWGLWFDWTLNDRMNTAVVPTVKGMNPITGKKTEGYGLEKYENKCPVHGSEFKDGLFCEECNYRWPHQNYLSAPNVLWWDGFRTADGKVRQFFFTEDLAKSIPELVLGKNETVPAFGFAFYRTKNHRVVPEQVRPNYEVAKVMTSTSFGTTVVLNPQGSYCYTTTDKISFIRDIGDTGACKIGDVGEHKTFGSLMGAVAALNGNTVPSLTFDGDTLTSTLTGGGGTTSSCLCASGGFPTAGVMGTIGPCGTIGTPELRMRGLVESKGLMGAMGSIGPCGSVGAIGTQGDLGVAQEHTSEIKSILEQAKPIAEPIEIKLDKAVEVGVGAGAEIRQALQPDLLKVDEWQEEPAAVMRLYFIFVDQFKEIAAKGMKDLTGSKDGFIF